MCLSGLSWGIILQINNEIRLFTVIKIRTQVDIVTEIPVFYRITNANVYDVNAMDWPTYKPLACYVFDRGYFYLARLYQISVSSVFFIIREKKRPDYEIIDGSNVLGDRSAIRRFSM